MKEYFNFIDGEWVKSSSHRTFDSLNPATEKPLGKFQKSNHNDVDRAIRAAELAFPAWSSTPAPQRGEILLKIALLLRKEKQRLGNIVALEMGKVLQESLGDVQEAIDVAEYMSAEGRRLFGHTTPSELPNKFAMTVRAPLGVVALITPWNFPVAIPAWKIMSALICGNTIVFKPSSDTPLCAVELVKVIQKAGLPQGVLNLITGAGDEVGNVLIKDSRVSGISFTGNRETGEFILKNAGLKRMGLELGGKNPIIVMDDADLDLAVEGILWGGFGTTGQRCTAASRVIAHKKVKKQLLDKLMQHVKRLKLGPGYKPGTDVGPLINQRAVEKVEHYVKIGQQEGAKLLCGGKRITGPGFFYQPTIFSEVKPSMVIAREEIFGPVVSVIEVNDLNEAIQVANNVDYGLSSSIYTNNIRNAFTAMQKIEAGIVYVNSSTIGAEVHLPFGGVKATGNGTREAGIEGINEFSEIKTIYVDYSGKLQKAQGIQWGD